MSERVRQIEVPQSSGRSEVVLGALEPGFDLVDGTTRPVRRSWLDTFDWRLHRAGLTLEQRRGRAAGELVLSTNDGEVVGEWPGLLTVPGVVDGHGALSGLAGTAIGDRVGPLLGVRALLEVAAVDVLRHEVRLFNADGKTVARVDIELPAAVADAPVRVMITPVRGYENQAARAERLLATIPGAAVVTGSRRDSVLAAGGRRAGDYTGKVDVRLNRADSAAASVARVVLSLVDTVEANLDGVLRDIDTEFLHDLRVAVRRIRSAVKLLGDVLPADLGTRLAAEFKWLGDLTTPVRDLDVYLLDFARQPAGATGDALAPFQKMLAGEHRTERRRLVTGLRSARFTTLRGQWRETLLPLAAPAGRAVGGARADSTGRMAAARIAAAHRRLVRRGAVITTDSPGAQLHDLRKRGKELRALLDVFSSILEPAALSAVTKELKVLQDCLGDFQDSEVQAAAIVQFAERMSGSVAVPTLLAMGALTERLEVRQAAARDDFAAAFGRFARPATDRRMQTLVTAARG